MLVDEVFTLQILGKTNCKFCKLMRVYLVTIVLIIGLILIRGHIGFLQGIQITVFVGYLLGGAALLVTVWRSYTEFMRYKKEDADSN